MKDRLIRFLNRYGRMITGIGILACAAGLALSYIRPKQKLETVAVNMAGEGDADVVMKPGTQLEYVCSTKGYPMAGIQVGITKYGKEFPDGQLLCAVYTEDKEELLSQTLISMNDVDEGQYVYIPFENEKRCNGTLAIVFSYTGTGEDAPGLLVNRAELADARTLVDGVEQGVNLKSYYVYKLAYYPLVFDLCITLFILLGVFFLSENGKKGQSPLEKRDRPLMENEKEGPSPFKAEGGNAGE